MAVTPALGLGKGPVDRLATYFLRKFQETKSESKLYSFQCTAQLKFEEIEKTINEHAQNFGSLQEQMRSFWDTAPAFNFQRFSEKVDNSSAGSSDKMGVALDRLHQKLDDEVNNLNAQLSDVSARLAVSMTSLNAKIDDANRKIRAKDDMAVDNLLQYESGCQSKLSKFMSLLESTKIEEASERLKTLETFRDTHKKLQEKTDKLEITTIRQSIRLVAQEEKIKALETEARNFVRLNIDRREEIESSKISIQDRKVELIKLQNLMPEELKHNWQAMSNSDSGQPDTDYARGEDDLLQSQSLAPALGITQKYLAQMSASSVDMEASLPPYNKTSTLSQQPSTSDAYVRLRKRRLESPPRSSLPVGPRVLSSMMDFEPPSKRQQTLNSNLAHPQYTENDRSKESRRLRSCLISNFQEVRSAERKPTTQYASDAVLRPRKALNSIRSMPTTEPSSIRQYNNTPDDLQDVESKDIRKSLPSLLAGGAQIQPLRGVSQIQDENHNIKGKSGPSDDRFEDVTKKTNKSLNAAIPASTKKQDGGGTQVTPIANGHRAQFFSDSRRAATRAFAAHAKKFAKEYNSTKPRSERRFIWSFLDGIPDPAWATYMQQQLLEAYPKSVHPSLGVRAKHVINFGEGLVWRDVVALIRTMQQRTVPIHLDKK